MNTSTLDKLRKMKFFGMFHAFKSSMETGKTNDYTADELLAHLVDAEWDDRQNRRIERTILYARFRYKAAIEDVHYHADRSIDRNQIMRLADCTFVDRFENLLITGSTGIGKSYIASAVGYQACVLGYRVLYTSVPKLFAKLKMAKADGSYMKELAKLELQQLLILDDFGIQPFDAQSRAALMEIIEDRHGKTSLIITSQLPVSKWFEVIGEKTIADAILDRIVHDAHRIELKGESMRRKRSIEPETSH